MVLSQDVANYISWNINSLLVYHTTVNEASQEKNEERMKNGMRWFNEAADNLKSVGIFVAKYELEKE